MTPPVPPTPPLHLWWASAALFPHRSLDWSSHTEEEELLFTSETNKRLCHRGRRFSGLEPIQTRGPAGPE